MVSGVTVEVVLHFSSRVLVSFRAVRLVVAVGSLSSPRFVCPSVAAAAARLGVVVGSSFVFVWSSSFGFLQIYETC